MLNCRFFEGRNDYLENEKETEDALRQLKFWNDRLDQAQRALRMAVLESGMRLDVVEQASAPPTGAR